MGPVYSNDSKWIGCKNSLHAKAQLFYFRRVFKLNKTKASICIRVSADSRYKLYVNDKLVSTGPCKGNIHTWYYETVDVTDCLVQGINVIAAEVLHFAERTVNFSSRRGIRSVERTSLAAFLLDGVLLDRQSSILEDLSTDEKWKVKQEEGIVFLENRETLYVSAFEHVDFKYMPLDWRSASFDDSLWDGALIITESMVGKNCSNDWGGLAPWMLEESPIPQLTRIRRSYDGITKCSLNRHGLEDLITGVKAARFPPETCSFFEMDPGEYMTGYFNLSFKGGMGSVIKIQYSECYESYQDGVYIKGKRDNSEGVLRGDVYTYQLSTRISKTGFEIRPKVLKVMFEP